MRSTAVLLLLGASAAQAGPLGLRTQGTLRELFLDVTGADARPIERPDVDVRWSMANTWNAPMQLVRGPESAIQELDEQADSLAVRIRFPWQRRFWTSIEGRFTAHWGGWSDTPIESWHDLVGSFNYLRNRYPRNQLHLVYRDDGGTAFDLARGTVGFGDVVVRTQASLVDTADFALAARLDLKLPTGSLSRATGSGGFDVGTGLVATVQLAEWANVHGLLAFSRLSNLSAPTRLQPKEWHFTAEASLEFLIGETALLIEDRIVSPLLDPGWRRVEQDSDDGFLASGVNADFRAHNQLSFGFRRGRFSAWLSEDFTPGSNPRSDIPWLWVSNAPDVVIGFAWTTGL